MLSDPATIFRLINSELSFMPNPTLLRSLNLTARLCSINWILRVHEFYHFKQVTALLSINYMDRFLSQNITPEGNETWMYQLVSVACLSLAAKLEEPNVPLLLNLQILNPKFVFESETIQRMELRVSYALDWCLRSVTPLDYVEFFVSMIDNGRNYSQHYLTASNVIVNSARVVDFLEFPPSVIAAAAVICEGRKSIDFVDQNGEFQEFCRRLNKNLVRSCQQLMEECLIEDCQPANDPSSPTGVLDARVCGSCDTLGWLNGPLE